MRNYKILLCIAAAGLSFAACNNHYDENEHGTPSDPRAISFDVAVPKTARAATTSQTIREFRVWAFAQGKPFMSNIKVSRDENSPWTYSPTMYWPLNQTLNFYCVSPEISTGVRLERDGRDADIPGFVNREGKTDLLYAVNIGESKSPVHVNFRHALSQINFNVKRATRTSHMLKVEVNAVDLLGTYHQGDFEYPDRTTAPDSRDRGEWDNQTGLRDASIYGGGDMITLLNDKAERANNTGYIFAIPQELLESKPDHSGGAYVRVLCSIYDQQTNLKLWPPRELQEAATESGYIYFPLNRDARIDEWEPGKFYNYTLTIDVPESASAISFDVTVDDMNDFKTDLDL